MKNPSLLACIALSAALTAHALNIKYDDGQGNVSTLSNDAACTAQSVAQGAAGNVRVICTERSVDPPVPVYSCAPLARVDVDAQRNYDAPGWSLTAPDMTGGQAYVMSFKTGSTSPATNMVVAQEYGGDVVTKYLRISESPCDFSVPAGYAQQGSTTRLFFTVGAPVEGVQMLKPDTQYYINLENADAVAAPGINTCFAARCGFVLTFYR